MTAVAISSRSLPFMTMISASIGGFEVDARFGAKRHLSGRGNPEFNAPNITLPHTNYSAYATAVTMISTPVLFCETTPTQAWPYSVPSSGPSPNLSTTAGDHP